MVYDAHLTEVTPFKINHNRGNFSNVPAPERNVSGADAKNPGALVFSWGVESLGKRAIP